jgi:hypothetical protein
VPGAQEGQAFSVGETQAASGARLDEA